MSVTTPKAEVFGTYSYLRLGQTPGYGAGNLTQGFDAGGVINLNRWLGAVGETSSFWGKIPLTAPFAGITNFNTSLHTIMGGPRISYRKDARVTPFVQVLVGGARLYNGYSGPAPAPTAPATPAPAPSTSAPAPSTSTPAPAPSTSPYTPPSASSATPTSPVAAASLYTTSATGSTVYVHKTDTVAAWSVGGGVTARLSTGLEYVPFQVDYLQLRPDVFSGKAINNLRISTGIAYRWGAR